MNRQHNDGKYTIITLDLIQNDAYVALSMTAKAALPIIRLEWCGPKNNNNGKIRLSVRQLAKVLGCTANTAAKALQDLQRKGFIVVKEAAKLGLSGSAKGHVYELTELPIVGQADGPTKSAAFKGRNLYKDWQVGKDYPIANVNINNPFGKNGRLQTKPHLKK